MARVLCCIICYCRYTLLVRSQIAENGGNSYNLFMIGIYIVSSVLLSQTKHNYNKVLIMLHSVKTSTVKLIPVGKSRRTELGLFLIITTPTPTPRIVVNRLPRKLKGVVSGFDITAVLQD